MPVERKTYSVKKQMILAIFPFFDMWASYRIMKLRLWLLFIWVGFGILGILIDWAIYGDEYWDLDYDFFEPLSLTNFILFSAIEIIVAVILMRKWTIEWNKKIESEGNMG